MMDLQRLSADARNNLKEERRGAVGKALSGKIIAIVYTKRSSAFRVITAREASDAE